MRGKKTRGRPADVSAKLNFTELFIAALFGAEKANLAEALCAVIKALVSRVEAIPEFMKARGFIVMHIEKFSFVTKPVWSGAEIRESLGAFKASDLPVILMGLASIASVTNVKIDASLLSEQEAGPGAEPPAQGKGKTTLKGVITVPEMIRKMLGQEPTVAAVEQLRNEAGSLRLLAERLNKEFGGKATESSVSTYLVYIRKKAKVKRTIKHHPGKGTIPRRLIKKAIKKASDQREAKPAELLTDEGFPNSKRMQTFAEAFRAYLPGLEGESLREALARSLNLYDQKKWEEVMAAALEKVGEKKIQVKPYDYGNFVNSAALRGKIKRRSRKSKSGL